MDWISAREAIESLGGSPGDAADSALAKSVMRHALEGRIVAHATEFQRIIGERKRTENEVDVPSEFWTNTKGHVIEQDWIAGTFVALNPNVQYREEWKAYGVVFAKDGLVALGGRFDNTLSRVSKAHGGGRPRGEQWQEFVAELCVWVYEGNDFAGMKAGRLIEVINKRLSERGVEEIAPGTAYAAAKAVLAALGKAAVEK